jgi:enoyl-CoA hydratase/carnithine racemase
MIEASLIQTAEPTAQIGTLRLNNPSGLNALNLEMVTSTYAQLERWKNDESVRLILLHSGLEKAFCAGGDVKSIALTIRAGQGDGLARDFFQKEYALDYLLRTYPKPILVWGEGIVMGGGLGLFTAGSHRVVTEKSILAMPEISIGFFPDVGAGYFLNLLSPSMALFLALTGARLSASDALYLGFANFTISAGSFGDILRDLQDCRWSDRADENGPLLESILRKRETVFPESKLPHLCAEIERRLSGLKRSEVDRVLREWLPEDAWLGKCLATFRSGSPTSAHVIISHLGRTRGLPLEKVFQLEWELAVKMVNGPDFLEGIRAVLIDKTGDPKWSPELYSEVTDASVSALLS